MLVAANTFVDRCCFVPGSKVLNVQMEVPRICNESDCELSDRMTLLSEASPLFLTVKFSCCILPAVITAAPPFALLLVGSVGATLRTDSGGFGDTTNPTDRFVVFGLPYASLNDK